MDIKTFEEEVQKIVKLLYSISWSMLSNNDDCADAVQEALTKAWQKRDALRSRKAFKSWMMQIQYNVCKDMLRKRKHQAYVPLEDEHTAAMVTDMRDFSLTDMLQYLSPEHRTAIVLHYVEGYRVNDIAKMTGVPVGTVKTRLLYARAHLKKTMGNDVDWAGGINYER